jgi:hypothetical protein
VDGISIRQLDFFYRAVRIADLLLSVFSREEDVSLAFWVKTKDFSGHHSDEVRI